MLLKTAQVNFKLNILVFPPEPLIKCKCSWFNLIFTYFHCFISVDPSVNRSRQGNGECMLPFAFCIQLQPRPFHFLLPFVYYVGFVGGGGRGRGGAANAIDGLQYWTWQSACRPTELRLAPRSSLQVAVMANVNFNNGRASSSPGPCSLAPYRHDS